MPQLIELIRAAQRGEQQAMESLIVQCSSPIRQECHKIGISNHADLSYSDLMQEVYLQVWKKIHQFKGAEDEEQLERAFELWLRKSARSVLSDLVRNHQARKRKPENGLEVFDEKANKLDRKHSEPSGPSSIFRKVEEGEQVRNALQDCLDERSRQIVVRHVVDGETFQQIADSMSLSYDQVRYAFHCSQIKLAQRLL